MVEPVELRPPMGLDVLTKYVDEDIEDLLRWHAGHALAQASAKGFSLLEMVGALQRVALNDGLGRMSLTDETSMVSLSSLSTVSVTPSP